MRYLIMGCFLWIVNAANSQPSFIKDSLDNYIRKGMADWKVPGLSVVIVKNGRIVHMKGYGVRNIQTNESVDEHTLFMIASNTKLFTGIALSMLDHRKKISLDDKITRYFPDFSLYDKTATDLVTVRDLLTHRVGTKTFQGDFTFWNSLLSRKEIIDRIRLLKPVQQFRQDYGYCNSCYVTAGEVVEKAIGISWERFVTDSLLLAAGMTESSALSEGMAQRRNVATPYTTNFSGTLKQVPYDEWDNMAPAASIVSNVHDLAKWLFVQLDSGRANGKRIIPWPALQKTRDMNIVISSRRSTVYPVNFRGYGLGLGVSDYNGRQVYAHTGGASGMVSGVCFVPQENLGIAILTNNDNQNFFELLRYQILDAYLGVPYVNRSQQQLARFNADMKKQLEEIRAWEERTNNNKPPLSYEDYTGEYSNPLYGKLTITQELGTLKLKFHSHKNLTATMEYMDNNEWLLRYDNIEYGIFSTKFTIDKDKVISVLIKANDFVEYDPYIFTRKQQK